MNTTKYKVIYYVLSHNMNLNLSYRDIVIDEDGLSWQEAKELQRSLKAKGFRSAQITFDCEIPPYPVLSDAGSPA